MSATRGSQFCRCADTDESTESSVTVATNCRCPRDKHDIVIHKRNCDLFKNETFVFPDEICECGIREEVKKTGRDVCKCKHPKIPKKVDGTTCLCGVCEGVVAIRHVCECNPPGEPAVDSVPCDCDLPEKVRVTRHVCKCEAPPGTKEALNEMRRTQNVGVMPAVLESTHPLMQRFQQTLREFLIKENALAEAEMISLKDELQLSKVAYDKNLEDIYKDDIDCNAQRKLIEEYESTLNERTAARQAAEQRAKDTGQRQKQAREQLDQHMMAEREALEELESLSALCQQLGKWREDTESELTVSKTMSDKMKIEKRALAEEKRELDMVIFGMTNDVWKYESKLEMMRKQMEIKSVEMDKINDKVAAYGAEMEDLDLDKRRLVSLWNGVLNNIRQRDRVFDSVREDYMELQQNFRTVVFNFDITKKSINEEMQKGHELMMMRDKILYDTERAVELYNVEDQKRIDLETEHAQTADAIEMANKDIEMMKAENLSRRNVLKSSSMEFDQKTNKKLTLENEILVNLQECLLNDKAVESMANGIKNMRDISRKQEISLSSMENQHAMMMLDIELRRNQRAKNDKLLKESVASVQKRETEIKAMQTKYDKESLLAVRKQRDLDIILNKYFTLKDIFNTKTAQELRIEAVETQIGELRERTYNLQHGWLRLQGHVVKLTEQFQKVMSDINLNRKQLQICEQKCMHIQADGEKLCQERLLVERNLREMRGRLQVLARTRKDAVDRNTGAQRANVSITQEYAINLKNAEMQIIELEEEIDMLDKEKNNLSQDLDRVQREALLWQRKGILAVELRKNMKEAKSAVGEIGLMKSEIHRMEARREQLRLTSEKLAEDLARYVTRRENAITKTRALAAVEKAHGSSHVSQTAYHHKLKLAKGDVASATKQFCDVEARLKYLLEEQKRLGSGIAKMKFSNASTEERIAGLIHDCQETNRQKQWLLERVVRRQRFGSELAIVIRRQSLEIKKSKSQLMKEYSDARNLNDRIKYIVQRFSQDYPHFGDKLARVSNTLRIQSPSSSPRLDVAPSDCSLEERDENIAEKPLVCSDSCH